MKITKKMKHKIIFAIAVLVVMLSMLACTGTTVEIPEENQAEIGKVYSDGNVGSIYSFKYDECEYIFVSSLNGKAITHHEGCDNPKHNCR